MAKKLKLEVDHDPEFRIIGLSSTLKSYKLAFRINQSLQTNLKRIRDFTSHTASIDQTIKHTVFLHAVKDSSGFICLLQNRSQEGFLIPLYRQADYFFMFYEFPREEQIPEYTQKLKKTNGILTAFPIDNPPAKNVGRIFQDLEIHIMEKPE
ncbi:MAG: IPExxxVDY family protein [Bacteroidales bacterium]|nr:IPExxxVDY family protein [Bacteroidales bacterium]MCF8386651.1 IPExxxVDY family protein [Bacteroidales bacterium]MCF8399301.1 IPExxxVDY family protein [Bacteroidales bacterium]